jgi:DNA-directed RNA polymerase subunit RPC12/RpoP
MECSHCGREAKNLRSNAQHEIRCIKNPHRIIIKPSYGMLGKKGANQYTYGAVCTVETREKLRAASKSQIWDDTRRMSHSESMKLAVQKYPQSYSSSNRGRTKQIIVDGIKMQGQWEVDFYLWAKENGLNPVRPTKTFNYEWNGLRTYHPDFYIKSLDLYIEVKGYETERDRAKWLQFPEKLRIIKKEEINQIRKGCFVRL